MSYTKNIWVDQDVERPKTYEVTNNQDGSITLTDSFGLVTELGTPVNAVNMNHIEDGIDGCAIRKHNLTETFALGEWVLGGLGNTEGLYKSLVANNVGNAITDTTKWEEVGFADTDLSNVSDNAKILMSGMGMPSGTWITLTAGASDSTYIAPADGYVQWSVRPTSAGVLIGLTNASANIESWLTCVNAGFLYNVYIPVKKGQTFSIYYSGGLSQNDLYFTYAVGSESEAQ